MQDQTHQISMSDHPHQSRSGTTFPKWSNKGHGPKHLVQSPVSICSAASAATGLLIPGYQNLIRADRDTLARGATSLSVQDEDHRDDAHRIVDLPATDKYVQPVLFIFQLHNEMDTIWNPHPQQSRYCAKHGTHILSQRNIRTAVPYFQGAV